MTDFERLKADALNIFKAGVAAADPHDAVIHALREHESAYANARRVHIIAAGKAAVPMMRAALESLAGDKIGQTLAVTNYENLVEVAGTRVIGASHPLPDENGANAARAVEQIANDAEHGDLVLCLISGGASALLPAPVAGVSLDEKIKTNDLLLKSGADIVAMNTVRKALSRLKGGGLARAIAPANGLALILSDVPGDDLATIASGPTVPDPAPLDQALAIVTALGISERLPASVMSHLKARAAEQPPPFEPTTRNQLIGSNRISLQATEVAARELGYEVIILAEWLEGDVEVAAKAFHERASNVNWTAKIAILAGGETSVHVTGSGKGGRNQEMALRFAALCKERPLATAWAFLSGGTDGRDGPTDAAGGLTTPETIQTLMAKSLSVGDYLANNDAYHALQLADALVMTGATGTNVADLQVLLLG